MTQQVEDWHQNDGNNNGMETEVEHTWNSPYFEGLLPFGDEDQDPAEHVKYYTPKTCTTKYKLDVQNGTQTNVGEGKTRPIRQVKGTALNKFEEVRAYFKSLSPEP